MKSANVLLVATLATTLSLAGGPVVASNFGTITKVPGNALHKQLPPSGTTPPRHLECLAYPDSQIPTPIITTNLPGAVVITNNTSQTIPANTQYTYVQEGKTSTYQDATALAPAGHLPLPLLVNISTPSACDATIPG